MSIEDAARALVDAMRAAPVLSDFQRRALGIVKQLAGMETNTDRKRATRSALPGNSRGRPRLR